MKCTVIDGIMPGEVGVFGRDLSGRSFSFFVDEDLMDLTTKSVKVKILDVENDAYMVKLPRAPLEGYSSTILVAKENIIEEKS